MKKTLLLLLLACIIPLLPACFLDLQSNKFAVLCDTEGQWGGPGSKNIRARFLYSDDYFDYSADGENLRFEAITCLFIPLNIISNKDDLQIRFLIMPKSAQESVHIEILNDCVAVQDGKEHIVEIVPEKNCGEMAKGCYFNCSVPDIKTDKCFTLLFKKGIMLSDAKTGQTQEIPIPPMEIKFVSDSYFGPFSF